MIGLTAEHIEQAERLLKTVPGAAPRAMANAVNRAAETARTEAARKVREKYYIKHGDVIATMKITRATPGNPVALVVSLGSPVALTRFKVTPSRPQPGRKNPIIVRVMQGAGGTIKDAFVARMKSGHIGVFNRAGKSRVPIVQRYGPSVPQMLGNEAVEHWVEQKAQERMEERLDHEINRILEGAK